MNLVLPDFKARARPHVFLSGSRTRPEPGGGGAEAAGSRGRSASGCWTKHVGGLPAGRRAFLPGLCEQQVDSVCQARGLDQRDGSQIRPRVGTFAGLVGSAGAWASLRAGLGGHRGFGTFPGAAVKPAWRWAALQGKLLAKHRGRADSGTHVPPHGCISSPPASSFFIQNWRSRTPQRAAAR